MERIAEECGVATKTLYNQFGNKDQLIAAAIEELMVSVTEGAKERSPEGGLARILALHERMFAYYEHGPSLGKEMLNALRRSGHASPLQGRLERLRSEYVRLGLQEMESNGDLVAWATAASVDSLLKAHNRGLMDMWVDGVVATSDLRRRGLLGTCVVLYAVSQGPIQEQLRTLISTYIEPSTERPR